MKKVLAIVTGVVFVGLVACGPSAEEQKAMAEKATADSIAKADSLNALLQQASTAATDSVSAAPADSTKK